MVLGVVAVIVVAMVLGVVAVIVVAMVLGVVVVAVVTMSVVVLGNAGLQTGALSEQQSLFHGQVLLQIADLLLDLHDGVLHPFRRDDAERIHRRDQVVVGLSELAIVADVTCRPVKLLGVDFDAQGLRRSGTRHVVPGAQTVDDDHRQHDGRNHRPDQLQAVVVREERRLAVLVIGVFPGEEEEQAVHQHEDRGDDPDVEAHERVHGHTVRRSRRRSVVSVSPVEVGGGCEEYRDEHEEEVRVQAGVGVGDVLLTAPRDAGRQFIDLRQLPDGNDADDDDQENEQLHIDSVWGQ